MTTEEPAWNDRECLAFALDELLHCLDRVPAEERARCAESAACDLISTVEEHHPASWDVLYDLIPAAPNSSVCGLLHAMALVLGGPRRMQLARRAAAMRCDLPPQDWIDHIGTAVPTGRAGGVERRSELMWLIEVDDGLHTYCLMTSQDLDRDILAWAGVYPSLVELARKHDAGDRGEGLPTAVSLDDAVTGMNAALAVPGMWGVSTTVEMFGLFVRWQLSRLSGPSLVNLPMREWTPPVLAVGRPASRE